MECRSITKCSVLEQTAFEILLRSNVHRDYVQYYLYDFIFCLSFFVFFKFLKKKILVDKNKTLVSLLIYCIIQN